MCSIVRCTAFQEPTASTSRSCSLRPESGYRISSSVCAARCSSRLTACNLALLSSRLGKSASGSSARRAWKIPGEQGRYSRQSTARKSFRQHPAVVLAAWLAPLPSLVSSKVHCHNLAQPLESSKTNKKSTASRTEPTLWYDVPHSNTEAISL